MRSGRSTSTSPGAVTTGWAHEGGANLAAAPGTANAGPSHRRGAGGPTVILLHGIASSSVTFHNVLPLLESTRRCIAIDLLGFGESPAPAWANYTLADHAAAIERTVASLLREPFTVVGHSMGALIVARYAARKPRRVSGLVMVSPPIYLSPAEIGDAFERARMDFYLRLYEYLRTNRDSPRHVRRAVCWCQPALSTGSLRGSLTRFPGRVLSVDHAAVAAGM